MIYASAVRRIIQASDPVFVGGTTGKTLNTSNYTVSLTNLTGGIGTQPQAGDLIIIVIERHSDSFSPSGYTNQASSDYCSVWSKISDEDTSVTLGGAFSNSGTVSAIHVWRNATISSVASGNGSPRSKVTVPSGGVGLSIIGFYDFSGNVVTSLANTLNNTFFVYDNNKTDGTAAAIGSSFVSGTFTSSLGPLGSGDNFGLDVAMALAPA